MHTNNLATLSLKGICEESFFSSICSWTSWFLIHQGRSCICNYTVFCSQAFSFTITHKYEVMLLKSLLHCLLIHSDSANHTSSIWSTSACSIWELRKRHQSFPTKTGCVWPLTHKWWKWSTYACCTANNETCCWSCFKMAEIKWKHNTMFFNLKMIKDVNQHLDFSLHSLQSILHHKYGCDSKYCILEKLNLPGQHHHTNN